MYDYDPFSLSLILTHPCTSIVVKTFIDILHYSALHSDPTITNKCLTLTLTQTSFETQKRERERKGRERARERKQRAELVLNVHR